jgi:DNA repair protein RadC
MNKHIVVKEMPESERPYEKFLRYGVGCLSDAELLAIIIKTGTKDRTSLDVARELLYGKHCNLLNLYELSLEEMQKIPGIGQVKAIQLKAAAELSLRIAGTKRGYHLRLDKVSSIADYYMERLRHESQEILMCAYFDAKANFLGDAKISVGSTSYAYFSAKDVLRFALQKNATMLVLLHNHPSGDPTPSQDDIRVTERMRQSAQLLDMNLVDHIIIGDNQYFSFKEQSI